MICPNCKDDLDSDCFINKVECLETTGEVWCDLCFETYCEKEANTPEKEKTCGHDQWLAANGM